MLDGREILGVYPQHNTGSAGLAGQHRLASDVGHHRRVQIHSMSDDLLGHLPREPKPTLLGGCPLCAGSGARNLVHGVLFRTFMGRNHRVLSLVRPDDVPHADPLPPEQSPA